jgi:pyruvate kinase
MAGKSSAKADPLDPASQSHELVSVSASGSDPLEVLDQLTRVRENVRLESERILQNWNAVVRLPEYQPSARSLAGYLALRSQDLSNLQPTLSALGLSSLGRCEGHVMANLDAV